MKKYCLHDGKEQHGPYNEEELKQKAINRDTLVWTECMEDWKKAGELDDFFTTILSIELINCFYEVINPFELKGHKNLKKINSFLY